MIKIGLKKLASIVGASYEGADIEIHGVTTDSRFVKPGNLLVTWSGEAQDGHDFIPEAIANGAVAALGTKSVGSLAAPVLVVDDSIKALGLLGAYWRRQFDLPIIGVTGSNGKTTVKNMVASVLKEKFGHDYLAPQKSYNNHVGVPFTLTHLASSHKAAVIEMGMNHFGEIEYLTKLTKPTVAIITNAAECHLEGVGGTVAGVAKAKSEIFLGLSDNGTAVLNRDDEFYDFWREGIAQLPVAVRQISFGMVKSADVMASDLVETGKGTRFNLSLSGSYVSTIQLPLLGKHNVMNALAAIAALSVMGIELSTIVSGLEKVSPEPHRLELLSGYNDMVILDDSYNANPNSVRKALDVLKGLPGKKIAILGDMRELGEDALSLHAEIGRYAKDSGVAFLFGIGDLMAEAVQAFGTGGQHFKDREALLGEVKKIADKETIVLVKGSNSMRMIEFVLALSQV